MRKILTIINEFDGGLTHYLNDLFMLKSATEAVTGR